MYKKINKNTELKVMIVEDDEDIRDIYKALIFDDLVTSKMNGKININLTMCSNGKEAVEKYLVEKPDLVLMDMIMPLMNGDEATRQILNMDALAKIVIISAYALDNGIQKALDYGACMFWIKPPSVEEICDFIFDNIICKKNEN